ncbi:response regulator transcription factor [Flammeovirga sp. MY04]|uniref:Transcriptional regulator n=1 Tax=Flammeovirga yaeyamensis TaxID=367791 RepID=D0PQZ9_9BACT|nr:LuxR C-terminal-related transcriptional regulator [Flammeovirga sp. MY04]ACY02042.1 transcriptional regulator [Flammeovirga yaeyamensis]ANQ51437.1 response regulator transcription factor [Flammeovirga sp. MY04]
MLTTKETKNTDSALIQYTSKVEEFNLLNFEEYLLNQLIATSLCGIDEDDLISKSFLIKSEATEFLSDHLRNVMSIPVYFYLINLDEELIFYTLWEKTRCQRLIITCFPVTGKKEKKIFEHYKKLHKNYKRSKGNYQKLTHREKDIANYLSEGLSNQDISDKLFISINTTKNHRRSIVKKLNCTSIVELQKIVFANRFFDNSVNQVFE